MGEGAAEARPPRQRTEAPAPSAPRAGAHAATPPAEDAADTPAHAAALVAALWRQHPPDVWTRVRRGSAAAAELGEALAQLADSADRLAADARAEERAAAWLLGETARALRAAVGEHAAASGAGSVPVPDPTAGAGGTLASPIRLRLARMERWLATRAAADPSAEPAVDLCLWVLEHLEVDAA